MRAHAGGAAVAGVFAGLMGALGMGLVAMVGALIMHQPWYFSIELLGSATLGSAARLEPGLSGSDAAVGLLVHLLVSAGWGALFGLVVAYTAHHLFPREGLWWGALAGIVIWVVDVYILLAALDVAAVHALPVWFGALCHLAYGSVLGLSFHALRPQGGGGGAASAGARPAFGRRSGPIASSASGPLQHEVLTRSL